VWGVGVAVTEKPFGRSVLVYRNRGWQGTIPMPRGDDSKKYPPKGFTGYDGRWP